MPPSILKRAKSATIHSETWKQKNLSSQCFIHIRGWLNRSLKLTSLGSSSHTWMIQPEFEADNCGEFSFADDWTGVWSGQFLGVIRSLVLKSELLLNRIFKPDYWDRIARFYWIVLTIFFARLSTFRSKSSRSVLVLINRMSSLHRFTLVTIVCWLSDFKPWN